MNGTVEEVFSRAEELSEAGLDIPLVARMALAMRRAGIPLEGEGLYTVEGVASAYLRALSQVREGGGTDA